MMTTPTNDAAGITPVVLHYYVCFIPGVGDNGVVCFLLTAAAIGIFYKKGASISGAGVGCQDEVEATCSTATGVLYEVLDDSVQRVENVAEIGMGYSLGLICDPVDGLIQMSCIKRNVTASMEAINVACMALRDDG